MPLGRSPTTRMATTTELVAIRMLTATTPEGKRSACRGSGGDECVVTPRDKKRRVGAPSSAIGRTGSKASPRPTVAKPASKMLPVEFMQERANLDHMLEARLVFLASPKSLAARVEVASDKLDEERKSLLPLKPADLLEKVRVHTAQLEATLPKVKAATPGVFDQLRDEVLSHMAAMDEITSTGEHELAAILFQVGDMAMCKKNKKDKRRYKRVRVQGVLMKGGFGGSFAKSIMSCLDVEGEHR